MTVTVSGARLWGVAGLLVAAVAGGFSPLPGRTRSIARASTPLNSRVLPGPKSNVDVSFAPSAIVKTSTGEGLTLHLQASAAFREIADAKIAYAIEIAADDGRLAAPLVKSAPTPLAAGTSINTDIQVAALTDGYYRATVTVVAAAKAEDGDLQRTVYWRVLNGRVEPMEFNDWFNQSPFAGKAVTQ